MAEPSTYEASRPNASRRLIFAWCLYDFANSPFTTQVVTFLYPTFFARVIFGDENRGNAVWGYAITAEALIVASTSPILGALADASNRKRHFLTVTTLLCAALTAALTLPYKGQVVVAWLVFLAASVCYEISGVFYNAFLPTLAPEERLGRVSGYGWALGYAGGLLALVVSLGMVGFGGIGPWVTEVNHVNVRATNLLVAGWFVVFSLPMLLWVPEPAGGVAAIGPTRWSAPFAELARTFRQARRYRELFKFLLARLVFNDALVTIFSMSGLYASNTFKMDFSELTAFGIWFNVPAGVGAFFLGHLDDRIGGKRTILITLVLLIAATLFAAFAQSDLEYWLVRQLIGPAAAERLATPFAGKVQFWVAGTLIALMVGPNQAASRSLMSRFTPASKEAEFFGFFAFSGKATAPLGVFAFSTLLLLTGNQRWSVLSVALFFIVGLLLLLTVNEPLARRQALSSEPPTPAG